VANINIDDYKKFIKADMGDDDAREFFKKDNNDNYIMRKNQKGEDEHVRVEQEEANAIALKTMHTVNQHIRDVSHNTILTIWKKRVLSKYNIIEIANDAPILLPNYAFNLTHSFICVS